MKKNGKDSRPGLPPIRKIEVSEERKGLRIALAAVFLAIGAVAIIIGLVSLLNTELGWQEVEINANGANCAGEFVLMYDFSDAGASASAVNKPVLPGGGESLPDVQPRCPGGRTGERGVSQCACE